MSEEHKAPIIEHVRELRARLMWALAFIVAGAGVGYLLHDHLLRIVQAPLKETLYFTTPTGALGFILKVCVVFGILVGLPMIMYQIFAFFGPLLKHRTKKFITLFTFLSVVLALLGVAFAYFITLPAALKFLVGFADENIQSLITTNEYFNFAFAYILGFAVLFQIPLLLLFINRVTPLPPKKLLGSIRYVVLASFILAAVITPTPDPVNQAMMAGPAIALYLISVAVVIAMNASKRKAERPARPVQSHEHSPHHAPQPKPSLVTIAAPLAVQASAVKPQATQLRPVKSMDFVATPSRAQAKPEKGRPVDQRYMSRRPIQTMPQRAAISDFI